MPAAVVDMLETGVRVRCADGTVVECDALKLGPARKIMALLEEREDPATDPRAPGLTDEEKYKRARLRGRARLEITKIFAEAYPTLADHLSPGDVELLLPDFFWAATGASVPAATNGSPETAPTGTPSGAPTAPPGEPGPTP